MRGKRAKRLKKIYEQIVGRAPNPSIWKLNEDGKGYTVTVSEIRRFRHDWQKARRSSGV